MKGLQGLQKPVCTLRQNGYNGIEKSKTSFTNEQCYLITVAILAQGTVGGRAGVRARARPRARGGPACLARAAKLTLSSAVV